MMHYVVCFLSFFPSPENMLFLAFLHTKAVINERSYANFKKLNLKLTKNSSNFAMLSKQAFFKSTATCPNLQGVREGVPESSSK